MADAAIETESDLTAVAARTPSSHGELGVLGAAAIVAGSMIGSGVFLLPVSMAAYGSISILGWGVATLAALSIAGVFVWLSAMVQGADGLAGYVRAGLGPFTGAVAAMMFWSACWTGTTAVALAAAGGLSFLVPALGEPVARLSAAIGLVWLAVAICWVGPRFVAKIEGVTLAFGLLPVLLVATVGWFYFSSDVFQASWNPGGQDLWDAVGGSALSAFWAFLGLECAAATAGVVRNPRRNVPRATLLGVMGAAALYISASTVIMGVLPAGALAASQAPFGDAAQAVLGITLGAGIALFIVLRLAGCVTGWVLITAQSSRGAADDGVFPRAFRTRPGEKASPVNLLTAGGLMTLVLLATANPDLARQFTSIINAVSLLSLYIYVLAALSLARLALSLAGLKRVGAWLTVALAVAFSVLLIREGGPVELALSAVPIGAGAVLYLWLRKPGESLTHDR
jgi:arginine:agmatine antiporter